MNIFTSSSSSSSLSLTSWPPASLSSSSLNSNSSLFTPVFSQPAGYVANPTVVYGEPAAHTTQPPQRQQRPITGQHNFQSKQKQTTQFVQSAQSAHGHQVAIQVATPTPTLFPSDLIVYQQAQPSSHHQANTTVPYSASAKYSRKVFVGGLPPDIDQGKYINSYYMIR